MRMRFWATIRRSAFSITSLMAPVRLRSVASGLRIEKVRSIAIGYSFTGTNGGFTKVHWRRRGARLIPVLLPGGKMGEWSGFDAILDAILQEGSMLARYRMFAGYNAWCNERLFDASARVSDADYRANRGVFFKALHGTLNHLLVG